MREMVFLSLALLAGMGLGLMYFGGLWLTVQRLAEARRPALLAFGSFAGRAVAVLLGFYLVMDGRWENLAVCLLGFLLMRLVLMRRWRPGSAYASAVTEHS